MESALRLRLNYFLQTPSCNLQQVALSAVFALIGLLLGTWASAVPAIQEGLQISHSTLSLVLLCGGLGGVLSPPVASFMMRRIGGNRSVFYAGLGLCIALPAIGVAPNVVLLMLAVLMLGLAGGCAGIGMNAVAAKYEKTSGKPCMSMLHACGCAGSLAGALLGTVVASMQIEPSFYFIRVAIPIALLLYASFQLLGTDDHGKTAEGKKFALPSGRLAALGVLSFCAVMSENSIAVWSGTFLKQHLGVTAGFAPLALSAFTVMMLVSRLIGDKLKEKHGARSLITAGAAFSAAGLFVATFAPNPYLALAGFACSGMGLSLVFPFVISAAGKEGALALTGVVTMTNISGLIGPPVIGAIAGHVGMQATIGFIGTLSIVISLVACKSAILK